MLFIGADLGTSGLKMILMDERGTILSSATESYPISYPKAGWSEQNPEDWWEGFLRCTQKLTAGFPKEEIKAIGIDGQMHGLVMLDEHDQVVRPAILWNDGRSTEEVRYLNEEVGVEKIAEWTGNIAFAGFTAPKILWVKNHEPENFKKTTKMMLPKDYLNYRLTGVLTTEMSDAAGMLLLDVKNRTWSKEMLELCGITEEALSVLRESADIVGEVLPDPANHLGFSPGVQVVAGASDNASAAIGAGAAGDGACNLSLGTSGTVFVATKGFHALQNHAVHNFAHADGGYHFLGCMLSAASANAWWMGEILETKDFDREQSGAGELGESRILFLPYLMGERSPHNNPLARGAFLGLSMDTTRKDMTLAVLEGVAFGLRDSLEVIKQAGITPTYATLCGGGAKSILWQKIVANVLQMEIGILESEEGPALGSAILASVGYGIYPSLEEACKQIVKIKHTVKPDPIICEKYDRLYELYKAAYPAIRVVSETLSKR